MSGSQSIIYQDIEFYRADAETRMRQLRHARPGPAEERARALLEASLAVIGALEAYRTLIDKEQDR